VDLTIKPQQKKEAHMSNDINQNPSRPGKIASKKGNPYRGSPRALFLGQGETAEEKATRLLAEQWDRDHPDGVDEGGGIA
jgi:hypothetical protein